MRLNVSLQLYSVRNKVEGDLAGLLKKVKSTGYDGVEFAGFFNTPAKELKRVLDDLGLVSAASHTGLDALKNNLTEVLDYNAEIGTKHVILPYCPGINTKQGYLEVAELCRTCAVKAKAYNIGFGFHNHADEISQTFDGTRAIDIILGKDGLINFQADVYWIGKAGFNPAEFLNKYPGRLPVIHLKDTKDYGTDTLTEVGDGIVGIESCIKAGLKLGTQWFTVEQDEIIGDEFASIKRSLENVREISRNL